MVNQPKSEIEKITDKELQDARNEANGYIIDERDLRNIGSLDDAFQFVNEQLGGMESFADYGTGFEVLDKRDKDRLVKTPFAILEWRFQQSKEYKSEFVSMLVVTKGGEKFVVNDGSTGICKQLRQITDDRIRAGRKHPQTGLAVENGLRRSDYMFETTLPDGTVDEISASTYYLS